MTVFPMTDQAPADRRPRLSDVAYTKTALAPFSDQTPPSDKRKGPCQWQGPVALQGAVDLT